MFISERICPRCQAGRLKTWKELTGDEKFVFERLSPGTEITPAERRSNLFCPRCRFETIPAEEKA